MVYLPCSLRLYFVGEVLGIIRIVKAGTVFEREREHGNFMQEFGR